jgi:hypothetical protein
MVKWPYGVLAGLEFVLGDECCSLSGGALVKLDGLATV